MKEVLIEKLSILAGELGRSPTRDEYLSFCNGAVSSRAYEREFGSYTNMLLSQGLKARVPQEKCDVTCDKCGKSFEKTIGNILKTNRNFCSRSCSAKFNNRFRSTKHTSLPKRLYTVRLVSSYLYLINVVSCQNCGSTYVRKGNRFSRYNTCSGLCRMEWGMKNKVMKDCVTRSGANTYDSIRSNARNYSKHFYEPSCENCGYDKYYEVCHIKDLKDFSREETLYEVNNKDNLVHLCPNCHWEFDKGVLKLCEFRGKS